jgi:hypothetical protein
MKKIFTCLFIITFSINLSYSQTNDKAVRALADSAVKAFTWDIQKEDKGELMFLDVAYKHADKADYLTLTVAKDKSKPRPVFISVIVPSNIDQSQGIFMTFVSTVTSSSGERTIKMSGELPVRLNFETCTDETCTIRMVDSYVHDKEAGRKFDIIKHFLEYDHVLFLIMYKDGSHQSVMVPLFSFKAQYKTLE